MPIILVADRQIARGYTQINIISIVLSPLAQSVVGDWITFAPIFFDEVQRLFIKEEQLYN